MVSSEMLNTHPVFRDIVREFAPRVYQHAFRILGDSQEAEEASQDVFLRIYRSLPSFRGEAKLSTWIYRITMNVSLTRRRKQDRQNNLKDAYELCDEYVPQFEISNPEDSYIQAENREKLARLISKLPKQEAVIITLFYLEGLGYSEIAGILDIPMGSIATALHRGRQRLRTLFMKEQERKRV